LAHFLKAQDIHFSQIGYSPLNLNPALTGVFEGDMRFTGNYRTQWNDVAPFETFSGAVDWSFYTPNYQERFFSAGVLINHDVAGDGNLSFTTVGLSGSYTHRVGAAHYLSAGAMLGYNNRSFDFGNFQFGTQYNTETSAYDPSFNAQESYANAASANMFDVSAGINWHYRVPRRSKRTSFDLGLGIMHFNQPEEVFLDGGEMEQLPIRWSPHFMSTIQVQDRLDVLVNATYQHQNTHRQFLYGAGLQFHLDTDPDEELAFQLLANRRAEDAWVGMAAMRYRMWLVGFSYDFNTSDLQVAPGIRSGPELSVRYIWTRVKPEEAKICPLYL
jgi:type IX secretion system PorP/SprF family membrane protein